jgi:23S rRNA (adenine2030-N6)-methyltransferase
MRARRDAEASLRIGGGAMNYRHAFHAGNFADVMKHALLARVLVRLNAKSAPYRVIDTHAGAGLYDLAGEAAMRTGEWREGVARVAGAQAPEAVAGLLKPWLDVATPMLNEERPAYPGSPLIALRLSRTQDRLTFIEKHPEEVRRLKAALAGERRARVLELDGWTGLSAQVPPPERRGLVLIDPPFEQPGEFPRMTQALAAAHRKWPTGVYILWHPIKDPAAIAAFHAALRQTGVRKILGLELHVDRIGPEGPMGGSGLVIVNPPWRLKEEAELVLPWLARRLARGEKGAWLSEWIAPE